MRYFLVLSNFKIKNMEQVIELLTHIDKLISISFWFCAITIMLYLGFQLLKYVAAIIIGIQHRRKRKKGIKDERSKPKT